MINNFHLKIIKANKKLNSKQVEAAAGLEGFISSASDFEKAPDDIKADFIKKSTKVADKKAEDTSPIDVVSLKGNKIIGITIQYR